MSDLAIRIDGLGKKYRIGAREAPYRTLRESIVGVTAAPIRRIASVIRGNPPTMSDDSFWALRDVTLDIEPGEVVGIIGRNGAGKTTLLKILSRITKPTEGQVDLWGRVGSLLEVGTGFHPELTGRENISLNGAILGMSREAIQRKFDEIVEFAEIERFLDTPVKHYSSGMYVRLAFAVAAHNEPEILLVDEVLAVGDAAFQRKCLSKMSEVAAGGRTVLFVSHNLSAITNLCSSCIYLKNGHVELVGKTEQAVDQYLLDVRALTGSTRLRERKDRLGTGAVRIIGFYITDSSGAHQQVVQSGADCIMVMEYERSGDGVNQVDNVIGGIAIIDEKAQVVLHLRSSFTRENFRIAERYGTVRCRVRDFNLAPGRYSTNLFLGRGDSDILDLVDDASVIEVQGGDYFGTGSEGIPGICKVLTKAEWTVE